jgi:preprotein translocase subunit SecA
MRKIKHNVLNAKQHQKEADVVAEAGQKSAVTIATNMAGRGTDIKLGEGVKEVGGLAIIGTERHESRRVDRQLRGRAGRQGDPGSSKFFVSLEDDLMRLFGSERIAGIMDKLGMKEGENIEHSLITKNIERAQKRVEQNNFGIRKRLLEYDDVMNSQREVIYSKRRNALYGDKLALDISNMLADTCEELVETYQEQKNYSEFKFEVMRLFAHDTSIDEETFLGSKLAIISDRLFDELLAHYYQKTADMAKMAWPVIQDVYSNKGSQFESISVPLTDGIHNMQIPVNLEKAFETEAKEISKTYEKFASLFVIDNDWKEHLREMDDLKQSSQNAVFEQKDPLLIYKLESFNLFKSMLSRIHKQVLGMLFKGFIPVENASEVKQAEQPRRVDTSKLKTSRTDDLADLQKNNQQAAQGAQEPQKPAQIKGVVKIGRNDVCPCGSGKKYKSCHGKEELN